MLRFPPRLLIPLCAALLLFSSAAAQDQTADSNPNVAIRAVYSYASILKPELVKQLSQTLSEPDDLAFAIVNRYEEDKMICTETAQPIKDALVNGLLRYEDFVFYLADMLNGPAMCAPVSLEAALAQLESAGIPYPPGDANGLVTNDALDTALSTPVTPLPVVEENYDDDITPTTGQ